MTMLIKNWGIMSMGNETLLTLQDGSLVGAPSMYTYVSAVDTLATIKGANYFAPVVVDLAVGDVIFGVGTDSSDFLQVTAVNIDAKTVTVIVPAALGNVVGPAVSTDHALARWDGVTGALLEDSTVLLSDAGDLSAVNSIANAAGLIATPSYTFTGDLDTGMWHSAANTIDFSTNAFRALQLGASPAGSVNYMIIAGSATTVAPNITAAGTDGNIGIRIIPKGTGALLNAVGALATPSYSFTGNTGTGMWSSAGGVLDFSTGALRAFQVDTSPAVAVNYLVLTSAAAGNGPILEARGTDANIDIYTLPKGTGGLSVRGATNAGSVKLWNQANTFYTQIQSAAVASSQTYTMPLALPTASGQVLSSDTAGVQSWVNNAKGTWIDQAATPVTMAVNTEYGADTGGLLTFNMPATAAFGDTFEVAGFGAGGWLIRFAGGQTGNFGNVPSTVAGSFASTNRYDCIKIVCVTANTTFVVLSSVGSITVA